MFLAGRVSPESSVTFGVEEREPGRTLTRCCPEEQARQVLQILVTEGGWGALAVVSSGWVDGWLGRGWVRQQACGTPTLGAECQEPLAPPRSSPRSGRTSA